MRISTLSQAALVCSLALTTSSFSAIAAQTPSPTVNNLSVVEALATISAKETAVVDVRTNQEYQLIGHIEKSFNVPFEVWSTEIDLKTKQFKLQPNPAFVQEFMKLFPEKNVPYMIVCRSGNRSTKAIEQLQKIGYTNLLNLTNGIEGDAGVPVGSSKPAIDSQRLRNGWRVSGQPLSFQIDPTKVVIVK